ncbi:methyltransferase [Dyella sp. GSA-30]|nr:methyltransferase [Dyella sp. GSA-30]
MHAESGVVKSHAGYCPCCRRDSTFTIHGPWLRDEYLCDRCESIPRQRHLVRILDTLFPQWRESVMHESSPSLPILANQCPGYTYSHYFPDVQPGSKKNGVRCESIEGLTFADNSLDLFVTQDVLEHVFHPDVALREIHRVLKVGGAHVFTAPKHESLAVTQCRATIAGDGTVTHVLPEQYHGNPVGDGKALVTWDYGSDFERMASEWVGATVSTYHTVDRSQAIDAAFNEVFVIVKYH